MLPLETQTEERIQAVTAGSRNLYEVRMTSRETADLIMLGSGAFSPLKGFMTEEDYESVLQDMRLSCGVLWPIPVTLAVSEAQAAEIREGQSIALLDGETRRLMARMVVHKKYRYDKRKEVERVFCTADENHPGVAKIFRQEAVYLGGPVEVITDGDYPRRFPEYASPTQTRKEFTKRGWSRVTAFQTRNPLHMSHEYLIRIALEVSDGVLIHPIVGALKQGDVPSNVRMKCYHVLVDQYLPEERVVLKACPLEMRYGGPREAVLHAIIRQNFGCDRLVIGRDHAGVGNYYGPFDAQKVFDDIEPEDLAIRPLKMETSFWCYECNSIATRKTCPHGQEHHLMISGTELRAMLSEGRMPPDQFSRPEVLDILAAYYKQKKQKASVLSWIAEN